MDEWLTADANESRKRETLGQRFEEIREICVRCDYELDTGGRSNRESWISEATT